MPRSYPRSVEPTEDQELRLASNGHSWRWTCGCGAPSGVWYASEEEALKAGRRHVERHQSTKTSPGTGHIDAWLPILEYRDVHDVPRLILQSVNERFHLLDCPFDQALDDYPSDYAVCELGADPRRSVPADWRALSETGRIIGRVPVESIAFDPTRRKSIKSDGLPPILKGH